MGGRERYAAAVRERTAARMVRRVNPDYTKIMIYRTLRLVVENGKAVDVDFGDWFWECPPCRHERKPEFFGHSGYKSNVEWDASEHNRIFHGGKS